MHIEKYTQHRCTMIFLQREHSFISSTQFKKKAHYQKETRSLFQKGTCTCMMIAALLGIVKTWKQPKCPSIDEWINKILYIYIMLYIYLEKAMASHSSTLAWKIPWMEKPGRLQSMGSQTIGCNWATSLSLFTFMHWRRKWQPTPVFLPGESQGRWSLVGCRLLGRTESDMTEATEQQQQPSVVLKGI